jgi:UDP-N-acetylmuramate dehydrogenase
MHSFDDFRAIVKAVEPLAPLTWFRLGGPAAFLARPGNVDELIALIGRAREVELPFRILSSGSNVLVRDEGFPGLVIHLESPVFADVSIRGTTVDAGAAVPLTALISQTARAGLAGLEVLTGIPGTVGAALRGNSGGRQGAIGSFVRRATVLDSAGQVQVRECDELTFGYRSSDLDDPVILGAEFELEPEEPEAVVKRMRRIWIIKKENQPYGHQSSGCIFKNPTPEISAGALVEGAGLKGLRVGGAEVSDRHANFIVAQAGSQSSDVLALIDQIRHRVAEQSGYKLELQINLW